MMSPAEPTFDPDGFDDAPIVPGADPIPPTVTRPSVFDSGFEPDEPDWPAQATTTIVNVVGIVRDKTTGSVLTAARALVFGILAVILAFAAAVLGLIFAIRLITVLTGRVWLTYLILGVIFTGAGLFVFRKRLSVAP